MAKLDLGIIAGLVLGVGAYILARTASGTTPPIDVEPTVVENLPPSTIIPTDSEITSGSGQTGVFDGIETAVILPTQIESSTHEQTPVTQEIIDTVKEDLIGGELDPSQEQAIIEQITDLNASLDMLWTGQINVDEDIKFRANHSSTSGVSIKYDWIFTREENGKNILVKHIGGADKQYVTMAFNSAGQYKCILTVSSSTGRRYKVTKVFNVIPTPLSYGDVKISAVSSGDRVIINVQNHRDSGINGSINISARGSNSFTRNYNMHINSKGTGQHVLSNQNSGSTTYSISYRPVGSSRALDNLTKTLNISGSVSRQSCILSNTVKSILSSLKHLKYPSWFENNINNVKICKITESEFINSYNYLLRTGVITSK
jgi:hypothetical protein